MLAESLGSYIDLDKIDSMLEIPIKIFQEKLIKYDKSNEFQFEEKDINDASSSINYNQHQSNLMINIYGPKECKFRDKIKNDEAIIEVYTKFNHEVNKESNF